jgi:hypothetical protein
MTIANQKKDRKRKEFEALLAELYPDLTLGQAKVAFRKQKDMEWEKYLEKEQEDE